VVLKLGIEGQRSPSTTSPSKIKKVIWTTTKATVTKIEGVDEGVDRTPLSTGCSKNRVVEACSKHQQMEKERCPRQLSCQNWLRPIFLHAFGCNIGLAYIHRLNIETKWLYSHTWQHTSGGGPSRTIGTNITVCVLTAYSTP